MSFLEKMEGESIYLTALETSIPKITETLLNELRKYEEEYSPNPDEIILYNLDFVENKIILSIVKKRDKINTKITDLVVIHEKLTPSFFVELKKFKQSFGTEYLTIELLKYPSKKSNTDVLVLALTEIKNGACETPIQIMPFPLFIKKFVNDNKNK